MKNKMLTVKGTGVVIFTQREDDYISLTDIARYKNKNEPKDIVKNWMRSKSTIEFLGLWEKLNNPDFKGVEFDPFMNEAGSNAFVLSPQIHMGFFYRIADNRIVTNIVISIMIFSIEYNDFALLNHQQHSKFSQIFSKLF